MNKFKFYFILSFITLSLFSCDKNDDKNTPPRDRAEQYTKDIDSIEEYLKTHYVVLKEIDGLQDVEINEIPAGGTQVSIWNNTDFPLQFKMVKNDSRATNLVGGESTDVVDYKMYYMIINQGGGRSTTTVDSTFTTYRGWKLDNDMFDTNINGIWSTYPAATGAASSFVSGYRQFLPLIKSASTPTIGGDSGIGVVFIPSGLGYFNQGSIGLPAYSPLVFIIRNHHSIDRDHDGDGVRSLNEDLNHDGNYYNDDTDGDDIPDFIDYDDDNDRTITKFEIRKSETERYEFDEIPNCQGTTGGLKKYLDPSCH